MPSLEQVPGAAITFGIPVGVSTEPVLHAGRQVGSGSSQEKVDVIWHPAIGDHVPRRALHFVGQTVCEPSIVTVVMKDCPATIAARDDVVNRSGELPTRRSGHRSGAFRVEKRTNANWSIRLKTGNQACPPAKQAFWPLAFKALEATLDADGE